MVGHKQGRVKERTVLERAPGGWIQEWFDGVGVECCLFSFFSFLCLVNLLRTVQHTWGVVEVLRRHSFIGCFAPRGKDRRRTPTKKVMGKSWKKKKMLVTRRDGREGK